MTDPALRNVNPDLFAGPADVGQPVHLRASRCGDCGRTEFPALHRCPACGGAATDVELPLDGVLRGHTAVLHPPPGALVEPPYRIGVVELGGAIRILGLIESGPDDLTVGLPVETVAASPAEGLLSYAFRVV